MSVIRWEEPPPDGRSANGGSTKWRAIAEALRAHPGVWALVSAVETPQKAASHAHMARRGRMAGMTPGEFELVSRKAPDGSGVIYARYVGPSTEGGTQ